jgi:hypothetical protein
MSVIEVKSVFLCFCVMETIAEADLGEEPRAHRHSTDRIVDEQPNYEL